MQSHELESVQTAISNLFDALSDLYSEIPDPEDSPEAALLEIAFDDVEALDSLITILNDDLVEDDETEDEDDLDDEFDDLDLDFDDEDLDDEDDFLTDELDEDDGICDCCFCQSAKLSY